MSRFKNVLWIGLLLATPMAFAEFGTTCPNGYGGNLSVNNDQVLRWKASTKNQYHDRGYIQGTILQVLPDRNDHVHFIAKIGPIVNTGDLCHSDTIEVVYNNEFGEVDRADLREGATVTACGDYITSSAPTQRYQASPACAIVHWVHMNLRASSNHVDGFMRVAGDVYGGKPTQSAIAGAKKYDEKKRNKRD